MVKSCCETVSMFDGETPEHVEIKILKHGEMLGFKFKGSINVCSAVTMFTIDRYLVSTQLNTTAV